MKGSWLLAPVLVSVLAAVEAPTGRVPSEPKAPLMVVLQRVDDALAEKDVDAAVRTWNDAYRAALASRRWEHFVAVGDAYRRIGEIAVFPATFDTKAREIYLSALWRARQEESLDGVLRVSEALAALGDGAGVEQGVRIAEALASLDSDAQADVRAFAVRVAELLPPRGE